MFSKIENKENEYFNKLLKKYYTSTPLALRALINCTIFFEGLPTVSRTTTDQIVAQKSEPYRSKLSNSHTNTTMSFELYML